MAKKKKPVSPDAGPPALQTFEYRLPAGLVTVGLTPRAAALIGDRAQGDVDAWLRGAVQAIQAKADAGAKQLYEAAIAEAEQAGGELPRGTRDEIVDRALAQRADIPGTD